MHGFCIQYLLSIKIHPFCANDYPFKKLAWREEATSIILCLDICLSKKLSVDTGSFMNELGIEYSSRKHGKSWKPFGWTICYFVHMDILKSCRKSFMIYKDLVLNCLFYIVIREPNCITNTIVGVLFIYMNNTSVQVEGNVFIHNHTSVQKPRTQLLWSTKMLDTMIRLDKLNEIDWSNQSCIESFTVLCLKY